MPILNLTGRPLGDISKFARRVPFIERYEYSQNGEDGMLQAIFSKIKTTNKYYVEFGVEDGIECNSRFFLKHRGWTGLLMDGSNENEHLNLAQEFITAENIEELFEKYDVPKEFDLLSIDIDGNDYWVWKAITNYKPRIVVIEYNACFPVSESKTIPYQADFVWDKTDYMGATLAALEKLGKEKDYTLIATDPNGVNAFFVLDELVSGKFTPRPLEQIYHPARYKGKPDNQHPPDPKQREWIEI
jgi:hypothetical protein